MLSSAVAMPSRVGLAPWRRTASTITLPVMKPSIIE